MPLKCRFQDEIVDEYNYRALSLVKEDYNVIGAKILFLKSLQCTKNIPQAE